jgi:uncharacterized protein (DUF4415 family)
MQDTVKSRSGRAFRLPDDDEEAKIQAGIAQDPDAPEVTEEEFAKMRHVGRPKAMVTKQPVSIRLTPSVVEYFKSTGKGWQTRIDEVLTDYVEEHRAKT